jgi:hypothetical protein
MTIGSGNQLVQVTAGTVVDVDVDSKKGIGQRLSGARRAQDRRS